MSLSARRGGAVAGAGVLLVVLAWAAVVLAAPTFPKLIGRVVDGANLLSPQLEADLTTRLEKLERESGRQFVVVTLPTLQGYEIEDYGYQLGRAWGLGEAKADNGALLIVAPNERRVRIEVGYGLEPILTDAMSSVILQTQVLPRFKASDMPGGVVAGANAIADQLALPPDEARAKAQAAAQPKATRDGGASPAVVLAVILFVLIFLFTRGRRRRSGFGGALPWVVLSALSSSSDRHRGGWGGGGFGGGGGGGFSGGGGSFGGGGSSGSW